MQPTRSKVGQGAKRLQLGQRALHSQTCSTLSVMRLDYRYSEEDDKSYDSKDGDMETDFTTSLIKKKSCVVHTDALSAKR